MAKRKKAKKTANKKSGFFADNSGAALSWPVQVPNSCIESAEFIMQCIKNNKVHAWEKDKELSPNIIAHFGNGVTLNVTKQDIIAFAGTNGATLVDYNFTHLPKVGRGLILLHKRNLTANVYHMHLAAVIASFGSNPKNSIVISKMAERVNSSVRLAALATEEIDDIDAWRSGWFPGEEADYAVGLLLCDNDTGPSH